MAAEPVKKTPTELLAYQTELLEKIVTAQEQFLINQQKIAENQLAWLKAINEREDIQISYLKTISTVATIFGILLVLSICGSLWYGFMQGF